MVGVMFYINWRFTLIALSVAPVLFLVVFTLHPPHQEGLARGAKERGRNRFGHPGSAVLHARGEGVRARRLRTAAAGRREPGKRRNRAAGARPEGQALAAGGHDRGGRNLPGAVVWRAAWCWPEPSAGSLVVFILYLGKMYKPMQELSKMTDAYSKAAVGYERIREVLETERRGQGPARRAAGAAIQRQDRVRARRLLPTSRSTRFFKTSA